MSAIFICSEASRAILQDVPIDFSLHTIFVLAMPASGDVFGAATAIKCPCKAHMLLSANPVVRSWVVGRACSAA